MLELLTPAACKLSFPLTLINRAILRKWWPKKWKMTMSGDPFLGGEGLLGGGGEVMVVN